MELKKRIAKDIVVSADYLDDGICLRITKDGDKHRNSVAILSFKDGSPQLTVFTDTMEHAGIKCKTERINPKQW